MIQCDHTQHCKGAYKTKFNSVLILGENLNTQSAHVTHSALRLSKKHVV